MDSGTLWKPSVSLPRPAGLGHITNAYLVSALRAFTQIRPLGELQICVNRYVQFGNLPLKKETVNS